MRKRAPATVLGLGVGLAILLFAVLALVAQRGAGRGPAMAEVPSTGSDALDPRADLAALAPGAERESMAVETSEARHFEPAREGEPAALAGRIELDGDVLPEGARVHYRCGEPSAEDPHAEGWVAPDLAGRFWIPDLPPGRVALEFALPSPNRRRLLLPARELELAPGVTTELPLVWRSKQVNLRITGDLGGWNRARVRLTGAGYDAEFETDDDGRAELSLVGPGSLTFEASHRSGRRGTATLELAEDAELESVLIPLEESPARGR